MIEYNHERGTAFSIDVDGREYWITARHIITGAKGKPYGTFEGKTADIKLLNPGGDGEEWLTRKVTVLQPTEDIDVVVLVPAATILADYVNPSPETVPGLMIGESCEFLGFAYGGGWRARFKQGTFWMPYIKHCTVSGMDGDSHLWILDGINNPGFSGGPVFIGTGTRLKIAAVISGYHLEPTDVIRGDPKAAVDVPKDKVNLNSGFILAYSIGEVVDLIKKNPIGPERGKKVAPSNAQ